MRIVEINTVCDTGSTGRIAAGVARIAKQRGHEVWFAYGRGCHPKDICGYKIGNRIDFFCHVLLNFFKGKSGFGSKLVTKRFIRWLEKIQPDIIHLHNLHGFYIHVGMLFEYIKEQDIRIIWTLHDCWSFTGQCAHFDYVDCNKWKDGCHDCPIYRTDYPYSLFCDNSRDNYIDKKNAFLNVPRMVIVTPSEWLNNLVKDSFLKDYNRIVINTGIALDMFYKIAENDECIQTLKERYEIDKNCKVILGVANVWTHKKGLDSFKYLADMEPKSYKIVLIGVDKRLKYKLQEEYKGKIIAIMHTHSVEELRTWYNIADVFVNPTLEDTFPTTNIESLACGTPVVTYETGGSPEIIDDFSGRIVKKEDVSGLEAAICNIIQQKKNMSSYCVERARLYDMRERLSEYVDIMERSFESE